MKQIVESSYSPFMRLLLFLLLHTAVGHRAAAKNSDSSDDPPPDLFKSSSSFPILPVLGGGAQVYPFTPGSSFQQQQYTIETVPANPKIIGGAEAQPGEYPYFVKGAACGATLIWQDIILSAGQCKGRLQVDSIAEGFVTVSATRLGSTRGGAQKRKIVFEAVHPQYGFNQFGSPVFDFMVAKLDQTVTTLKPVELIVSTSSFPSKNGAVTAIGFGSVTSAEGNDSPSLQKTVLNYMTLKDCNKALKKKYGAGVDLVSTVCSKGQNTARLRTSVCSGDMGGPLIYNGRLLGVSSWYVGDCFPGDPLGFASIPVASAWIIEQICRLTAVPPIYCAASFAVGTTWFDFQYGYYAAENAWNIKETATGASVINYPFESVRVPMGLLSRQITLKPNTDYTLQVLDSYGDGMEGGSLDIVYAGQNFVKTTLVSVKFNFTNNVTILFSTP